MSNKFAAKPIYYHPVYNITVIPELVSKNPSKYPGLIYFASKWELEVYKRIKNYAEDIKKDYIFPLLACEIRPDFLICTSHVDYPHLGQFVAIEAKGYETKLWVLKWKQFLLTYPSLKCFVIRNTTELSNLESWLKGKNFRSFTDAEPLTLHKL